MKRHNRFTRGIGFMLLVCVGLFTGSCGSKKAPETLTIKIIKTSGEVEPEIFAQAVRNFGSTHPGLILSASTEIIETDTPETAAAAMLAKSDVLIFSTLLNTKLRNQAEAYYPLSATEAVIPHLFDRAYAAAAPSTIWAMPLVLDPMVMVYKNSLAQYIPHTPPPNGWAEFIAGCEFSRGRDSLAPPY